MKKFLLGIIGSLVIAAVAVAAAEQRTDTTGSVFPMWITGGLYVGPKTKNPTNSTTNKMTRLLGASATIDFASTTITCTDSSAITVTGAQTGDPCFVGAPTTISGAGTGLNSSFTCYVSAADNVKVRHCAAGTADDPASATYFVRIISSQ
jgi:hypothetical protein